MLFQVKLHKTKSFFKEHSSFIINKLDGFAYKWFHVVLESFIPLGSLCLFVIYLKSTT